MKLHTNDHLAATLGTQVSSADTMVRPSNEQFQSPHDLELEELSTLYESRLRSLYEQLGNMCEKVAAEAVGYKESKRSEEEVRARVREFVHQSMEAERAHHVETILQDLASTKGQYKKLEKDMEALRMQNQELARSLEQCISSKGAMAAHELPTRERENLESQVRLLKSQLMEANRRLDEELRVQDQRARSVTLKYMEQCNRTKQDAEQLQRQVNEAKGDLQEAHEAYDKLKEVFEKTKAELQLVTSRCEDFEEENRRLEQKFSSTAQERDLLQSQSAENVRRLSELELAQNTARRLQDERDGLAIKVKECQKDMKTSGVVEAKADAKKLRAKYKRLKTKFLELKELLARSEVELGKSKRNVSEVRETYEKAMAGLHEELRKMAEEHKHQHYDQDLEYQRNLSELQSKHALELAQLQEEYRQLHEAQLKDAENELRTETNEVREKYEEFKKMHEDYVHKIEENWFSPESHDKMLQAVVEMTKSEKDLELCRLRETFEAKLKTKEEEMDALRMEDKKALDAAEDGHKKSVAALEERLASIEKVRAETETQRIQTVKEVKARTAELADLEKASAETKRLLEDERRKRKECENILQSTKKELAERLEVLEKTKQRLAHAEKELELMAKELKRVEDERNALQYTYNSTVSEHEGLQNSVHRELESKKYENEGLAQSLEEQQKELQTLRKNLQETREKDSEVIEQELSKHMETKTQLIAAEDKGKALGKELEQARVMIDGLRENNKATEGKLAAVIKKREELEVALKSTRDELGETIAQLESKAQIIELMQKRTGRAVENETANLRQNVREVKEELNTMRLALLQDCKDKVEELLAKFNKEFARQKRVSESGLREAKAQFQSQLQSAINDKYEEHAKQVAELTAKYEEVLKEKTQEMQHFQRLCDELEGKSRELGKNVEELETKLKNTQSVNIRSEKENRELKKYLTDTTSKLENVRKEASTNIIATKSEAESKIETVVGRLEGEHKRTLKKLSEDVDGVRKAAIEGIRAVLGDVDVLRAHQQQELAVMANSYEEKLRETERVVAVERSRVEQHRNELDELRQELDDVKGKYKALQFEMETRVTQLNKTSMLDTEKYTKLKSTRNEELASIQAELKQLRSQVHNKDTTIEDLTSERDLLQRSAHRVDSLAGLRKAGEERATAKVSSLLSSGAQTSRPLLQSYMRVAERDTLRESKAKSPLSLSQLGEKEQH